MCAMEKKEAGQGFRKDKRVLCYKGLSENLTNTLTET